MKPWLLTAVFTAAAVGFAVRAIRGGPDDGGADRVTVEAVHALMCVGMVAMAWTGHHDLGLGAVGQALAVVFLLGAVCAAVVRAAVTCLMAFGMALAFTPSES